MSGLHEKCIEKIDSLGCNTFGFGNNRWFDCPKEEGFIFFIFAEIHDLRRIFGQFEHQHLNWPKLALQTLGQDMGKVLAVVRKESNCLFGVERKVAHNGQDEEFKER